MAGRGRLVIVTERDRIIAKEILAGKPIYEALIGNGYSEAAARKGNSGLSKAIKSAMIEQGQSYEWMGEKLLENPKLLEHSVVGWLYQAMIDGRSKGVTAAKLLGQHKRVDMFAAENQNNVLVIQAPSDWKQPGTQGQKAFTPEDQPKVLPPGESDLPEYE